MRAKEYAKRILLVRKCASCREILDSENFDSAFCPDCRLAWQVAKTENCPDCFGAATECSCMPALLSKSGALTLRRLFFYSPDRQNEAQNKLVYYLKHKKSRRVANFAAAELSSAVKDELSTLEVEDYSEVACIGVPRGRRAVLNYGFDQSAEIAESLAEAIGADYMPVIKRRFGGREQKKLSAAQRQKNIKSLMYISEADASELKGRYVILIDDVVTTGASMSAAVSLLRKAGVRGVICACLASDMKKEISKDKMK